MKEFIERALQSKTIKHSAISFTGTLLTGILGAIFYILMARFLGPSAFGIFSVSVLIMTLISDIASVGIDTGIIRFVGKYINNDHAKALKFLKLGLLTKLTVAVLVITIGWILTPWIAIHLFNKVEFIIPLRLSLLGSLGILLFSFITSGLSSLQKYYVSNGVSVGANTLRLTLVLILFSFGFLNIGSSLVVYSLAPFVGFLTGMLFMPHFIKVKNEGEVKREFFHYNKWIAVSTIIAAISSRLDSFITARQLSLHEIGIYSVAVTLASIVPQIVMALAVVVAPKIASFDSFGKAHSYYKKMQIFVVGLALAGLIVGIPLSYFVIPAFYGSGYAQSIYPFIILLIAQAIFLISVPVHTTIIYYYSHPKLFVYSGILHMFIILFFGWFLIGRYGFIGASVTVLLGTVFNLVFPTIWLMSRFAKEKS